MNYQKQDNMKIETWWKESKYNYQNYLIKIQYPLLVQLQWHHAKMLYIGNNVTSQLVKYYISFYLLKNQQKDRQDWSGRKTALFISWKDALCLVSTACSRYFPLKILGLLQLKNCNRQYMVYLHHNFQNLNKPNCFCFFTCSN